MHNKLTGNILKMNLVYFEVIPFFLKDIAVFLPHDLLVSKIVFNKLHLLKSS